MITKAGNFRTQGFSDHGVSTTKNGFPQFVALLRADEFFDVDCQQWVALDTGEEMTGYFTLVDSNGKLTLSATQVKKVTGWDGPFSTLAVMDLTSTPVQFRVEEHLYNEQTTLQISWIDEYDAVPGAKVKKLEDKDLKALDAKYAALLKGTVKPATAPAATPAAAPATPTAQPKRKPGRPPKATGNPTAPAPTPVATPVTPVAAPTGKPVPPPRKAPSTAPAVAGCTKEEAWDQCCEAATKTGKDVDNDVTPAWVEVCNSVAPGKEDEQITSIEWLDIKNGVLTQLGIPF